MGQLRVMGCKGDDNTATWDLEKINSGDPEAIAAIEEAERIVTDRVGDGAALFARYPGETAHTQIGSFDPQAEDILVTLPIAGG